MSVIPSATGRAVTGPPGADSSTTVLVGSNPGARMVASAWVGPPTTSAFVATVTRRGGTGDRYRVHRPSFATGIQSGRGGAPDGPTANPTNSRFSTAGGGRGNTAAL